MSDRRFTDKPELAPWAVRGLAGDHPALQEGRTLFPSTVVDVTREEPDRILVSGVNNRKIGETVEKGRFKDWGIYGLSLEERATCPADCAVRDICYGNGMQMARRHRIIDPEVFYDRVQLEIVELSETLPGVLVRLHVLGDFPSVDYVAFWKDVLAETANVACYGYTRRHPLSEIGDAIQDLKDEFPDRFRIRWSVDKAMPDSAVVISNIPKGARAGAEEIVCPAQRDASECCATCGLCWELNAAKECIAFIKHGPKSDAVAAEAVNAERAADGVPTRAIARILLPPTVKPAQLPIDGAPECRMVGPSDLVVEDSYQRELSSKSIALIRKIVAGWDWAKFKPPVCAERGEELFVIDGQHTAIAAATHPDITEIPVMIVRRDAVEERAEAFVSQNTDRVAMNPLQIFYAKIAAKDPVATDILKAVLIAGGSIPRSTRAAGAYEPGEIMAMSALREAYGALKRSGLERLVRIAVLTGYAPINATVIKSLILLLRDPIYASAAAASDEHIATAFNSFAKEIPELERDAAQLAVEMEIKKYPAVAAWVQGYLEGDDESA